VYPTVKRQGNSYSNFVLSKSTNLPSYQPTHCIGTSAFHYGTLVTPMHATSADFRHVQ